MCFATIFRGDSTTISKWPNFSGNYSVPLILSSSVFPFSVYFIIIHIINNHYSHSNRYTFLKIFETFSVLETSKLQPTRHNRSAPKYIRPDRKHSFDPIGLYGYSKSSLAARFYHALEARRLSPPFLGTLRTRGRKPNERANLIGFSHSRQWPGGIVSTRVRSPSSAPFVGLVTSIYCTLFGSLGSARLGSARLGSVRFFEPNQARLAFSLEPPYGLQYSQFCQPNMTSTDDALAVVGLLLATKKCCKRKIERNVRCKEWLKKRGTLLTCKFIKGIAFCA